MAICRLDASSIIMDNNSSSPSSAMKNRPHIPGTSVK
jgi:hypothetical protein